MNKREKYHTQPQRAIIEIYPESESSLRMQAGRIGFGIASLL
jgi:hypothetical protein